MNNEPTYSYDKDADVLYISFSPGEKATSAVELNDNILWVCNPYLQKIKLYVYLRGFEINYYDYVKQKAR